MRPAWLGLCGLRLKIALLILFTSGLVFGLSLTAVSQGYASWDAQSVKLDNGLISRQVVVRNDSIMTQELHLTNEVSNFIAAEKTTQSLEFSLFANGKSLDGGSGWKLLSVKPATDGEGGTGAVMDILGIKAAAGLELKVSYYLFPKLPVIRKEIEVLNVSRSELRLEALLSEKLVLDLNFVESACFTNYGRQKHLGNCVGNWDDPLLAIHNYHYSRGLLVGNEAPGVLKHVDYNVKIK